jgi:acylaminoacyl-peptidase
MERMKGSSTTIKSIDRVDTPLLLLHATNDYRCSFEQAEQFFIAMKDRRPDIPVRLSAFPGENHGLTREGNMYSQRGHLLEMADWFDRYLNQKEED